MIKNLIILKKVLEDNIPSNDFSWLQVLRISRSSHLKNYYVGDKYKFYRKNKNYFSQRNDAFSLIDFKYRTTLFEHTDGDIYYYDILDHYSQYRIVDAHEEKATNVCKNVKKLDDIVKEKIKK